MRTALLMGGVSPEREVSLTSGKEVAAALQRLGEAPLIVDPGVNTAWLQCLLENKVNRVFNILHGGGGENGEVRGALSSAGIACTGSGVLGSAVAMNKQVSKQIWRHVGIPTPDWVFVPVPVSQTAVEEVLDNIQLPVFVKPACGGSSTRALPVFAADELPAALASAAEEQNGVLVERLVNSNEYTLSVVDDAPLPMIRISTSGTHAFYDYQAKYMDDATQLLCPCGLPAETEKRLADLAMCAFQALQCSHWGRVDLMLSNDGEPYFLEVNTVPGMTTHSLVPLAAKTAGVPFDALIKKLLAGATVGGGKPC